MMTDTSQADDELELEDPPQPQPEATGGAAGVAAPADGVVEPEIGIEELRAQLKEQTRLRLDAESRAGHSNQRASSAEIAERNQFLARLETYSGSIDTGLSLVNTEIASTKALLAAANADGKYDEVSDLQEKLSDLTANRRGLTAEKNRVDMAKKNPPKTESERLNEYVEKEMAPASQAWVKAHPQFMADPHFRALVNGADTYVISVHGETYRNTPAYFTEIERLVGLTDGEPATRTQPRKKAPAAQRTRTAATAMAPNRESTESTGSAVRFTADGQPVLDADQQRVATNMGMSFVDYAKLLAKAERDKHPALNGRRH